MISFLVRISALILSASIINADDDDADKGAQPTCILAIPDNPFSPDSLSKPWMVTGCAQYKPTEATFVEVVVYDPDASAIVGVYNPLVVDPSSKVGAAPSKLPQFPPNAVFGAWIGSNAMLALNGSSTTLAANHCVDGLANSKFGSFAYCNAKIWFSAVRLKLPPLGMASDGDHCVTTRDFLLTDKDQSDNVYSTYLVDSASKSVAQNTAANRASMPTASVVVNGDDTMFLQAMFRVLKCPQLMASSLTDPGQQAPALALDEIQGSMLAQPPVALVHDTDPDVVVDGRPSLSKRNLYREGVNQSIEESGDPVTYCRNYANSAKRILKMKSLALAAASPDPAMSNSLHTFQCRKFISSFDAMKCGDRLKIANPITVMGSSPVTECRIDTTALSGGGSSPSASKSAASNHAVFIQVITTLAIVFAVLRL